MFQRSRAYAFVFFALFFTLLAPAAHAQGTNQVIYDDSLQNGWQNWSWATVNLVNTAPVHAGSDSISVTVGGYSALYLHAAAFNSSPYPSLSFWINGGSTGGQRLQLQATLAGTAQTAYPIGPLAANTWQQITIPLSLLGVANATNMDGFWIQDSTGGSQPSFYVDDIQLLSTNTPAGPVTVTVDAAANKHAISPLIYGVAYADTASLQDLNAPLNRQGGNDTSMYNWQLNATNKGSDWFYESLGETSATPGERSDTFITNTKAGGAQAMLTLPMIGWVAKLGPNRGKLSSFSVAKYGAQQSTDSQWMPDAGNGVLTSGVNITGNDPTDANVTADATFQAGWINHLVSTWGSASSGGLQYYIMDNEPSIWHSVHRDVHPVGATMSEVKNDIVAYATKVKAADPSAQVIGPEEWGWTGYFYSGYDQQYGNAHSWSATPDKAANGNMDYLPWILQQLQQYQTANGQRLLDYFSVHFYPQAGEFSNDVSVNTELLRNRSTRQLWDPNYTAESWIGTQVQLIPRLKNWVSTYYPGTKTALTEYNWGAEASMNGATTQADVYGIFGREGLDMATRWATPAAGTPTYLAMKLYRNYDGNKSGFGDTSVSDAVPNPDNVSSFAAVRSSDGALTITVINKQLAGSDTPVTINIANFSAGTAAHVWQLTGAGTAITQLADLPVASGAVVLSAPAQSVTLLVIPAAAKAPSDTTPPTTTAGLSGTAGSNGWYTSPVQVTLAATDNTGGSGVSNTYYTLDGGTQQTYLTPFTISGDKAHSLSYWSVDKAGNTEAAHAQSINIDGTAPVVTFGSPSPAANGNGWNNSAVSFPYTATDATSGIATASPGSPVSISTEGAGQTVTVTAVDNAGNTSPAKTPAVNIDLTAPVTTVSSSAPATGFYGGAASVTLSASDNLSGVAATYYTIDGGAQQTYSSALSVSGDGSHIINYWSVDKAGNAEAHKTLTLSIDSTPPATTASLSGTLGGSGWYTTSVSITLTATDSGSGVAATYYTVDGGSQQSYTSTFNVSGDGAHSVVFWSVDNNGNTEAKHTQSIKIDATPPVSTASVAGSGTTSATVTVSANDATSGVAATYYTIDGGAQQSYTTPVALTTAGSHTVAYWSVDNAGNVEAAKSVSVTVAAPATMISLSSVTVPASTVAGVTIFGRVTLTGTATVNTTVTLSSNNTSAALVLASVVVPAGSSTASFGIATRPVYASTQLTISASYSGVTKSAPLTVNPGPLFNKLTISPISVKGGTSATGTITLYLPAPAGGYTVNLRSSNSSMAQVPSTVTVPAGSNSVQFAIPTVIPASTTGVSISASVPNRSMSVVLSVTP